MDAYYSICRVWAPAFLPACFMFDGSLDSGIWIPIDEITPDNDRHPCSLAREISPARHLKVMFPKV